MVQQEALPYAGTINLDFNGFGGKRIALTGNAKRRADAQGITRVMVTFTHEKTNAVAFAIVVHEETS